jgi:hypothetical protein
MRGKESPQINTATYKKKMALTALSITRERMFITFVFYLREM